MRSARRCTTPVRGTSSTDAPEEVNVATVNTHRRVSAVVAFVIGAIVAVQGRINGELGHITNDGVLAAVINFSVGLIGLSLFVFLRPAGRAGLRQLPSAVRSGTLPWWTLTGGLAGACFVSAQGVTVATLGVALFTIATVAGQTGLSLGVDHWGLGPSGVMEVSALRIVAAVLATVAVGVAAWGSGTDSDTGEAVVFLVGLAVFAGAVVAFQAAFNGRVSVATGQPTVAGLVNFVVGLTALLLIFAIQRAVRGDVFHALPDPTSRPWLYCGGLMGLIFVVGSAWAVRALGVLLLALLVIAGSLVGAVAVDLVAPTSGGHFSLNVVVGVVMTLVAVALASVRTRAKAAWQDSGS